MPAIVVYNGVNSDQSNTEGLFAGQKFWFSSTVPQRSRFLEDVKANGGEVVPLEKQADICLYDHARKNPPPGMYSYRYVERTVQNGQLEDLEAHRIGRADSRAARPVGSLTLASKGSRQNFTEADDQMLWEWVKPVEGMRGSAGNLIYRELEKANPRHTFQSWRDRWLKYVQFQKRELRSGTRQQQQDFATVQGQPEKARKVPRSISTGTGGASEAPKVAVKGSVEEPSSRKRGRPAQIQPENARDIATEVVSPAPSKQPQTPTSSTRACKGERALSEKTPTSQAKSKAGSWEFSIEDRDLLMPSVEAILCIPKHEHSLGWERMAYNYPAHTARQWRNYFEEVVVPLHFNEQKKSRDRKPTKTVTDPLQDLEGGSSDRKADSSGAGQERALVAKVHKDKVQQNGNEDNNATALRAAHRQRSPSFQPESSPDWRFESDKDRPGPNESRKRGSAKSSIQESAKSQTLDGIANTVQAKPPLPGPARHKNKHTREEADGRPTKRRRLSHLEVTGLAIPSTPEPTEESETLESENLGNLPGTPTPRVRRRRHHGSDSSFSPILVPSAATSIDEEEEEEEDQLPTTPVQNPPSSGKERGTKSIARDTRTSPISVHLVSDNHDPATIPFDSSAGPLKTELNSTTRSPTPEFETAPDLSQTIHQDSIPGHSEEEAEFETATEGPQRAAAMRSSTRADTQALFTAPTSDVEAGSLDFRLAEPEGGWDALEADADADADASLAKGAADGFASPHSSTSGSVASTQNLAIDDWLHFRTSAGQDPILLLTAAQATNMHKSLADTVYERLMAGEGLPEDVRGVWTQEDDEALLGGNARQVERVEGKHGNGKGGVGERWECLGVWGGG